MSKQRQLQIIVAAPVWLPTDPPRPAPGIMEPAEVAAFLRIKVEAKNVMGVLRTLRKRGLGYVIISGRVLFPLGEVLAFVKRESETNRVPEASNNEKAKEGKA